MRTSFSKTKIHGFNCQAALDELLEATRRKEQELLEREAALEETKLPQRVDSYADFLSLVSFMNDRSYLRGTS